MDWQYIDENADVDIPLEVFAKLIKTWQKQYGKKALIRFDAGANNVQIMIKPDTTVPPMPERPQLEVFRKNDPFAKK